MNAGMNGDGDGEKAAGPSAEPAPRLFARLYREFPSTPDPSGAAEESGKFVILARGVEIHLVLSPVAFTPYHADIVRQYLQVEGRGRVEGASASGCRILSPEWSVHGGGHFALQHWLHHVKLTGKSSAFGRYEEERLAPFRDDIPASLGLEGYTIEFD